MTEQLLGLLIASIAAIAFAGLILGDLVFRNLPQVRKLRATRDRLGEAVIDGSKLGPLKRGKQTLPAERLRLLLPLQLDTITLEQLGENDRFRTLLAAADIIALRARTHKRLIRELKALSVTICMVFVLGVLWSAYNRGLSLQDALFTSPAAPIEVVEGLTLVFLLYRLVQEYRDIRELNDGA